MNKFWAGALNFRNFRIFFHKKSSNLFVFEISQF